MATQNMIGAPIPFAVTQGGTGLASTTINQILYSSANNVIAGLATANSSVLITSGAGVPSLSTTLPAGLTVPGFKLTNTILDTNGNNWLGIVAAGSAVNYVSITNSPTTTSPTIAAIGTDTNIALTLNGKGNLGTQSQTPSNGSFPPIGYRGYNTTTAIATVTISASVTPQNIQSISLAAGNWLVLCHPYMQAGAANTSMIASLGTTSATLNGSVGNTYFTQWSSSIQTFVTFPLALTLSLATTTTVFLVGQATFTGTGPTYSASILAIQI